MTECLAQMGQEIIQHGVDAPAYNDFVQYTINALDPANNEIGRNFSNTIAATVDAINLFVLVVVFFVFFFLVLLTYHAGYISAEALMSVTAAALVIIVLFYSLSTAYTLSTATDAVPRFQQALVKSFLYSLNSQGRSVVYLAACE